MVGVCSQGTCLHQPCRDYLGTWASARLFKWYSSRLPLPTSQRFHDFPGSRKESAFSGCIWAHWICSSNWRAWKLCDGHVCQTLLDFPFTLLVFKSSSDIISPSLTQDHASHNFMTLMKYDFLNIAWFPLCSRGVRQQQKKNHLWPFSLPSKLVPPFHSLIASYTSLPEHLSHSL